MSIKFSYVLEHFQAKQPTIVAVCSSIQKAKEIVKALPKSYAYTLYKLPINMVITNKRKLLDQQGKFEIHHFGTHLSELIKTDRKGNVVKEEIEKVVFWPFNKPGKGKSRRRAKTKTKEAAGK